MDLNRLSRLTAILTQLQTKKLLTSTELAKQFGVSIRTIYRDIRSLEESGVPIISHDGKGYSLIDGYRLPPVTFTESEANALITAQQLIIKNKDASFVNEYTNAINKIKAVLRNSTKDKVDLLSERFVFRQNVENTSTSNLLSRIQLALTDYDVIEIEYFSPDNKQYSKRFIEPFAVYNTQENWILIAWCKLRNDFRSFRLDRIITLQITDKKFEPHKLSLQEYFDICMKKYLSNL